MNGEVTIYNILKNTPAVYDQLTEFEVTTGVTGTALAIGIVEPGTWKVGFTSISIYNAVGVNNSAHALFTDITVACRAPKEKDLKELAAAVVDALERYIIPGGAGMLYTFTGGIIPPEDPDTDDLNLPITVTIKAVKETV